MAKTRSRSRLLTGGQIGLIVTSVLLVIALGSAIVLAYINLSTTEAFQAGYVLSNLANVQREIIDLHMVTNRALRDRSQNFELVEVQRDRLDRQLQMALIEADNDVTLSASLRRIDSLLDSFDYQLGYLAHHLTEAEFRNSAYQFDSILGSMETLIQALYGNEELRFFRDIAGALKLQRTTQTLTIGIGLLLLVFGVLATLSIGRSVTGKFQQAYDMLKDEVAERRHAEEELRQQNAYLAALHETTLALMNRLDVDDLLEAIVTRAATLLGTRHGYIYLVNRARDIMERRVGIGLFSQALGAGMKRGQGVAGQVWASGQPVVVNDYASWPYRMAVTGIREQAIGAVMGAPLKSGQETVGVLAIAGETDAGQTFTDSQTALLDGFAQLASIALDNAQLFSQAEQRTVQIEALYRADEELYRRLNLNELLETLVNVAVDILKVDKSALFVWSADHARLVLQAARGFQEQTLARMSFAPGEGLVGMVAKTAAPALVYDTTSDNRVNWSITYPERIRSLIHVPIIVDDEVFGIFNVNYHEPNAFSDEDVRLMQALAQRTASAIENAKLYQQAQQAATLEERQRLARELHDAVTQTLFSASIIADILPRLWDKDQDEARRRLEELRELTRGALAEMRTLLLELRPTALSEASITELLNQLGEATTGRVRVPVEVYAEETCGMPVDIKIVFYRIAQEALNNIAKHAHATRVYIDYRCTPEGARLCIHDNGVGFDSRNPAADSLGLRIMRERAEASGAALAVRSEPGAGTEVSVSWAPKVTPAP